MDHLTATVVLLAVKQAGEEVVVGPKAWPWARHCCHRKGIVVFVLLAMAKQKLLEPGLA